MNSKAPALMVATLIIFAVTILISLLAFIPNRRGDMNDVRAPESDIQLQPGGANDHGGRVVGQPSPSANSPMPSPAGSNH